MSKTYDVAEQHERWREFRRQNYRHQTSESKHSLYHSDIGTFSSTAYDNYCFRAGLSSVLVQYYCHGKMF